MGSTRALFIINKLARNGSQDAEEMRRVLRAGGIEAIISVFEDVAEIKRTIQRHAHEVEMIIVGGGDGTLNAAIEPILATGLPLGVLPLGTANDLARTLQIPPDLGQAAEVITAGRIKKIDLGWVNHKHFFNVASIGLAVKISQTLTTSLKRRWSVLAYPITVVNAYRSNRPFRARVVCNGQTHHLKSIQIAIGNGRHYGGGMSIREDAAIDDQLLNLYSLKPKPAWDLIRAVPMIVRGRMEQGDLIRIMDGKEFQVTTKKPMEINTDGEVTARTPALFRVIERALPVFVP